MAKLSSKRLIAWGGIAALIVGLGACSTSVDDPVAPAAVATARSAATALPAATAMAAATAMPAAMGFPTAAPQPTAVPKRGTKYGGIAVFSTRGDFVRGADVMRSTTITHLQVLQTINGSGNLIRVCLDDPYDRSCPGLAESWEVNSDFTQWTFKIRDNVFWHDGTPFTAEDAKYWIDLSVFGAEGRQPSRKKGKFGDLASADVLDGNRVRITLNTPSPRYFLGFAETPQQVTHPRHIVQPEIDKGNGEISPVNYGMTGLGPFKFEKYDRGSVVSVRKFDKYWEKDNDGGQLPYLDGITFPIIPDLEQMVAAFRAGRIDGGSRGGGTNLIPEQMETIRRKMGDDAYFLKLPSESQLFGFNTTREPWQDVRLRRAAMLVFDRVAGAKALGGEGARPATLFSPGSPFVNPDFMTWPGYNPDTMVQDLAEAKRLMAEAGFPDGDGFKSNFLCRSGAGWVPECELLTEQFRSKLGLDITLQVVDDATYEDRRCAGDYDIRIGSAGAAAIFPETLRSNIASAATSPCAEIRTNDTKLDDFYTRLDLARSFEERVDIAREMERYVVLEQVYTLHNWVAFKFHPFRSYVKGLAVPSEDQRDNLNHAWVWLDK